MRYSNIRLTVVGSRPERISYPGRKVSENYYWRGFLFFSISLASSLARGKEKHLQRWSNPPIVFFLPQLHKKISNLQFYFIIRKFSSIVSHHKMKKFIWWTSDLHENLWKDEEIFNFSILFEIEKNKYIETQLNQDTILR